MSNQLRPSILHFFKTGKSKKIFTLLMGIFFVPIILYASHFRYGSISWTNTTGNTVVFRVSQAWRISAFFSSTPALGTVVNTDVFYFGDGSSANVNLVITSVNPSGDWFYGETTITRTYSGTGNFTAYAESCCRISTLVNNADGNYRTATNVNVGGGNSSPVSSVVPIIDVAAGQAAATFNITAADPNGNPLSYRFATSSEAGPGFNQPTGLSINGTNGQMTFNTVGKTNGQLYSTQIVISDGITNVPVDFLIRISTSTGNAPVFVRPPTPANGQVFNVIVNNNISFSVQASDADAGSTVTLSAAGTPIGATFTPALPTSGNPVSSTFNWTPTLVGAYVININAQDNTLQSANTSVTINVVASGPVYYSKSSGDLHNVLTWGLNNDGSGPTPSDFGDSTFQLANRGSGIYTMTNNWTVGGTINIPTSSQLQINGNTLALANKAGEGTFSGSATSNLTALASANPLSLEFTSGSQQLFNLSINSGSNATLYSILSLYNTLSVNGVFTLDHQHYPVLILKSTASNTARVAPVTGTLVQDAPVQVERYIPARRAWRIMAAPIGSTHGSTQTVNQAWQEGEILGISANPNPYPGYGTHITGGPTFGSTANGFDQNPGAATSIKIYSSTANNWVEQQNTNATAVNAAAYMLFVRGNRGLPIGSNTVPATSTTLRATGSLNVGDQTFTVNSTGFTAIPNPFASPINFATITRNGVQNNFYLWDPKMGGLNGVGAYVLLSDNGAGGYSIVPAPTSPESQFIQSGQGFLVRPTVAGTAGSITIKESDKSATAATDVFRTAGPRPTSTSATTIVDPASEQGVRFTLKRATDISTSLDEAFASYRSTYADKLDDWDAVKLANVNENLGIINGSQTLMLDRRQLPKPNDAIELQIWNTQPQAYILELNAVQMASCGLQAVVEDKFLKTVTPISLDGKSKFSFLVTGDAASAGNRFRVVFVKNGAGLITSVSKGISAYPNPLEGSTINLAFTDQVKDTYQVMLINSAGQVVFRKTLQHAGGTATQPLSLGRKPLKGIYRLQINSARENVSLSITCQ